MEEVGVQARAMVRGFQSLDAESISFETAKKCAVVASRYVLSQVDPKDDVKIFFLVSGN